jgi:hypothetical protein
MEGDAGAGRLNPTDVAEGSLKKAEAVTEKLCLWFWPVRSILLI